MREECGEGTGFALRYSSASQSGVSQESTEPREQVEVGLALVVAYKFVCGVDKPL